jgi:hypothetical protein
MAPYGALRPLTLLQKQQVRGKFNARACLSLAIEHENKSNTSALWRAGTSRTAVHISSAMASKRAVRRASTLAKIEGVSRLSTMPVTDRKAARTLSWHIGRWACHNDPINEAGGVIDVIQPYV